MAEKEKKNARNREWMRRYRATEKGRIANRESKRKFYSTAHGKEVKRIARVRWSKTEKAKSAARRHANAAYPRVKQRIIKRLRFIRYGLTEEAYQSMVLGQQNRCAICSNDMTPPHVDHDHKSGSIRGLLCLHCNHGLGSFRDSEINLARAIYYLKKSRA